MSYAEQVASGGAALIDTTMQILRIATGNLCDNVVDRTPVLTGNLQAHWQGVIEAGDIEASPVEGSIAIGISPASTTRANVRAVIERWDGFRPFFLYNPVVYGPRIEYDGWSAKAPDGMVRISAALWPFFVRDAAREVGGE
jgi:hypothetical protein